MSKMVVWINPSIGYDIGYTVEVGEFMTTVDIVSGRNPGRIRVDNDSLRPYSESLIVELSKKYGYEKRFSAEF